jgi:hypothetical protein
MHPLGASLGHWLNSTTALFAKLNFLACEKALTKLPKSFKIRLRRTKLNLAVPLAAANWFQSAFEGLLLCDYEDDAKADAPPEQTEKTVTGTLGSVTQVQNVTVVPRDRTGLLQAVLDSRTIDDMPSGWSAHLPTDLEAIWNETLRSGDISIYVVDLAWDYYFKHALTGKSMVPLYGPHGPAGDSAMKRVRPPRC